MPLPRLDARYTLAIDSVRFDDGYVAARETVRVTNREACALPRLNLTIVAARWGWFTLNAATLDGEPLRLALDEIVLSAPLARPLAAGATAELALDFRLDVGLAVDAYTPGGFAGTTRADDILRLAYWFPILSDDHQYPPFLDPPYTATADFEVTVTTPAPLVVAATGVLASERDNGDGTVTRHYTAPRVRDFTMLLSPAYTVTSRVAGNGVVVELLYIPRSIDPSGRDPTRVARQVETTLAAGVRAIDTLSAKLGPYPYPVYRIVDGGPSLRGGIEFPMLVAVTLNVYGIESLIYHETAHQWFYGVLGTRTQQDPWIDEGAASFLADYISGTLPAQPTGPDAYRFRLDTPVWAIPPGQGQSGAIQSIYGQGEMFYQAVRLEMGDEAFWRALRSLYRDSLYGIVTPRELLRHFQSASPVDLRPLFHRYLDYPWIDELGQ